MHTAVRDAGSLPRWALGTVAGAVLLSLFFAVFGPRLLVEYDGTAGHTAVFSNLAAIVLASGALLALAIPGAVPRQIRLAVALPALQLGALVVFGIAWLASGYEAPIAKYYAPLLTTVPLHRLVPGTFALAGVIGWAAARGRRPVLSETAHAMVMWALSALLLVGLWAPIASYAWPYELSMHVHRPAGLLLFVLVPPLAAATTFTLLAFRAPAAFARVRRHARWIVGALVIVASLTALERGSNAASTYANFVHMTLGFLAVALCAQLALAAMITVDALRARRALRRAPLAGTIAAEHDPESYDIVAGVEVTSWLRGPRAFVRGFTLVTARGEVPIPGARLATPLGGASTRLTVGEAMPVVRIGDRVVVAGLSESTAAADGSPFRSSDVPMATGDVVIGSEAGSTTGVTASIGLALWRPSVAYLLILVAVGLPALFGALRAL